MKAIRRCIRVPGSMIVQKYRSRQGWREISGRRLYFRSGWEVRIALYVEHLKKTQQIKEWEYEPKTFWFEAIKRGTRSYLPDFKITRPDGSHYWLEVKGYFDSKSLTKIKRFRKYYPEETLIILDEKWFKKNRDRLPGEEKCGLNGEADCST